MDGNVENQLIKEIEKPGKSSADPCVGAVHAPAQDDIARITCIPELPEILSITLSIRVEAEEIIGLKHVHAVADSPRVTPPLVGKIQPQRQLLREVRQDVLSVVSAAVFANDESHIDSRRQLITDPTNGRFDTLAFIVNWQQNFYVRSSHTGPFDFAFRMQPVYTCRRFGECLRRCACLLG
jgi:hypothetical protein